MNKFASLLLFMIPVTLLASEQAPYAGEEQRRIKSLSAQEIESLRNGSGMGLAKLAELNHFPGPKHVLEVAGELELSPSQLASTEALYEEMLADAVALGKDILLAESRLDQDFTEKIISSGTLESALLEIGTLRARLRYVHLEAHLRQQKLLTSEQIQKYDELRGYRGAAHDHSEHSKNHHE